MSVTQQQLIEEHLTKRADITSWDAITEYGITRLAKYIHDLKRLGFKIGDEYMTENNRKWKRYWLISAPKRTVKRAIKVAK